MFFVAQFAEDNHKCGSLVQGNTVSNQKEGQKNRKFLCQVDDFDQDSIFGDAAKSGQHNVMVNDSTVDQELSINNSGSIPTINMKTVNVQTEKDNSTEGLIGKWVNLLTRSKI